MLGIMLALNHIGYAVGNPLTNLFYDLNGSYTPVILGFAGILLVVTVAYQFIITAAHRDRREILVKENK